MRTAAALVILVLSLVLSAPAFAAETYTFVLQTQGDVLETFRKGKVLADGDRYRVELDEPGDLAFPFDVLVSTDGGHSEVGLFPGLHTYYHLKDPYNPFNSSAFTLVPTDKPAIRNLEVEVTEAPQPETVSGLQTRRYDIRVSYDVTVKLYMGKMKGKVAMEASYWMAENHEGTVPILLRPAANFPVPELVERLREPASRLHGLPVRQRVTVTTDSPGSPPRRTTYEVSLGAPEKTTPPAGAFEIPRGFQEKEPEISRPGKMPGA